MLLDSGSIPSFYIGVHNFEAWKNTNAGNYMLLKGSMDSRATAIWTTISNSIGRIKSLVFGESEDFVYAYCIEGAASDSHLIHRIKVCDACVDDP